MISRYPINEGGPRDLGDANRIGKRIDRGTRSSRIDQRDRIDVSQRRQRQMIDLQ